MAGKKRARRLAAMAVAWAVCGIVLAGAAQAQGRDDLGQLLAEVRRFSLDGRYADAVPLAERAVTLARKKHGDEHLGFAAAAYWLAVVYQAQTRYPEAERLYKHSLAVREKMQGKDHPDVGTTLSDLSILYRAQGRYAEAELLRRRSSAIFDRAGRAGDTAAGVFASLKEIDGLIYENMELRGSSTQTEGLLKGQLAMHEETLGPEHPNVGRSLHQLARVYREQGRYSEAETLYKRSLAIFEKGLGLDHPSVRMSLSSLAILSLAQGDWTRATDYWRRSADIIERRMARGLGDSQEGTLIGEARGDFWGLIRLTHRMAAKGPGSAAAAEMFETAQRAAISESAGALAQMAARSTKGSPPLAALIREWQDLIYEWRIRDEQLIAAKGEPPAKRKAETEKVLSDRLAAIDKRFAAIDAQLSKDFPNYAALARSTPISIAELQAQLKAQEALVLFVATPQWSWLPEETFIWVVTKSDVRWVRSELGTAALRREVAALRCGLDEDAWRGDRKALCAEALGTAVPNKTPDPLPFDHARAHKLYMGLFGQVRDLIKGKHLLIVPSGALTQLPFHVLVTRPPASGDHRAAAWLASEHAITVLPAVSSLKALRRVGRPSAAPRPMIGFGNPLLDGHDAGLAKLARDKQRCPEARELRKAALGGPRAGVAPVETRGGLADLTHLKAQVPLPETADELCAVARDVKADVTRDIHLGMKATEWEVKRLSASGELAKYRGHFATHGALAGQLVGTHEPGLILTPPEKATEADDGYLSASEIAALRFDADWVVLSACNTAAGGATNAEALSGLGRVFMYAGARSLLVSHWAVYSHATVKLITGAVREIALDPKVGRAEAMRRAMLELIDKGEPQEAHPAYWAPFVVVGEGAAGR